MRRILFAIYLLIICHPVLLAQVTGDINLRAEDFSYSKQGGYDVIRANGCDAFTSRIGSPELPVVVKTFVVPLNVRVSDVDVVINSREVLKGDVVPCPVKEPVPVDGMEHSDETKPDSAVYNGTAVYPGTHAEIIADYNEMGYHLVKVCINPVEWDPVSKKLYLNRLGFTLNYSEGAESYQSPQAQSRYRSDMIKNVIKTMVDNPQDVETCADKMVKIGGAYSGGTKGERSVSANNEMIIDILAEQIPDYIIITNREFHEEFQRLADWKIQKGVPAIIKDVEDINGEYLGSDLPEKIHAYLQECKGKWGEGLFVLLGGDINIVPARFYTAANSRDEKSAICPSDAYYSDLDCTWNSNGNHLYAERGKDVVSLNSNCYVGRASVENIEEATLFVNKVLAYEKMNNPSVDKGYLMNQLAVSAYIGKYDNGFLVADAKKQLNDTLKLYPQLNDHKWYLFDHYNCTCNKHWDKDQYSNGQELNKANFIAALNDGGASGFNHFHIVYHMDHCSPRSIGTSCKDKFENMFIPEIDNLNNGDYQQIVISGGCETTHFDKDCVAEHFINNPHGGAVAFIGNANVGYSREYNQYGSFLKEVYGGNYNLSLGVIFQKMPSHKAYPTDNTSTPQKMRLHLLGDPEMPVWSAVPQNIDANIHMVISHAVEKKLSVRIKNLPEGESAKVCLFKDKEIYNRLEIRDTLEHIVVLDVKSDGIVKATVTARNFIPYEKEIQLLGLSIGKGPLKIEKITGFDGSINIGDSAIIGIRLRNIGSGTKAKVLASLSTNSPYVRIIDGDSVSYGMMQPYSSSIHNFKIVVSEDAVEAGRNEWNGVCMYMKTWDASNTVCIDTFKIDITSPRLRIGTVRVMKTGNGNLIPEAGEYVELSFNLVQMGKNATGTRRLSITSLSDGIDEILIRSMSCRLKIADSYITGSPLKLNVVLKSGSVPQDSTIVDITETLPEIALGNIYGEPTSDAISLYWDKVGTVTKYNVYRSSSEHGSYVRLNKMPLESRYIEDIGLPSRTTFYYKVSTVAESCLEGPLSEPFMSRTTIPVMLYKEQVLKKGSPCHYECEANAVDCDYDGQKEIVLTSYESNYAESSVVVVVKSDGSEPYCIDGNTTNFSGFATFDWLVSAAPSVADFYGNGENSIVALSRKFGTEDNYAVCYSTLDKNGDNLPDSLWGVPSTGNVYRGAVITDIDVPDGKGEKEIIFAMESKGIVILNADGTKRAAFGDNITSNYCGLAVADLDGDGYKEIICGQGENLYVWKHDGTPYLRSPFFTRSGMDMKSSPVVCDIDNDGEKEIIVATRNNPSYIYAIKSDGSCVGNFDNNASNPVSIPYPSGQHQGLDHAVSVGDINSDGNLEVVALGGGCVRAWTNTGDLIFNRNISGLFVHDEWATHMTLPLLADIDGDSSIDIVFNVGNRIYAIHNDGSDVDGFQLTSDYNFSNNILISDIDEDGKNEIVAANKSGFITVWKTEGNLIEWGRARFDAGFTGEYVSGYKEPLVIKSDIEWQGGTYPNDVIVRSGTMKIVSGKDLEMLQSYNLIVMNGGTLEIDGGAVTNANIFIKSGGRLVVKNKGLIKLSKYASLGSENGAIMDIDYGSIE